jgi:hypothetical protein
MAAMSIHGDCSVCRSLICQRSLPACMPCSGRELLGPTIGLLGRYYQRSSTVMFEFSDHPMSRCPDHPITKAARRKNRGPRQACSWLGGWKFAAPQPVILKERPLLPRMKDLNRRSHHSLPLPIHPTRSQIGVTLTLAVSFASSASFAVNQPTAPHCANSCSGLGSQATFGLIFVPKLAS